LFWGGLGKNQREEKSVDGIDLGDRRGNLNEGEKSCVDRPIVKKQKKNVQNHREKKKRCRGGSAKNGTKSNLGQDHSPLENSWGEAALGGRPREKGGEEAKFVKAEREEEGSRKQRPQNAHFTPKELIMKSVEA